MVFLSCPLSALVRFAQGRYPEVCAACCRPCSHPLSPFLSVSIARIPPGAAIQRARLHAPPQAHRPPRQVLGKEEEEGKAPQRAKGRDLRSLRPPHSPLPLASLSSPRRALLSSLHMGQPCLACARRSASLFRARTRTRTRTRTRGSLMWCLKFMCQYLHATGVATCPVLFRLAKVCQRLHIPRIPRNPEQSMPIS
jgi:hypothetical protein